MKQPIRRNLSSLTAIAAAVCFGLFASASSAATPTKTAKPAKAVAAKTVSGKTEARTKVKEVLPSVFDIGTLTADHEKEAIEYLAKNTDELKMGGCTAIATVLPGGTTLVGRNMDYIINDYPAYVGHTAIPGRLKTAFLAADPIKNVPEQDIRTKGLPVGFKNILPHVAVDVMNEKGLYIEANMRDGDKYPDGRDKFHSSGTKPGAKTRLSVLNLPMYLASRAKTVHEAVAIAKTLDIYTLAGKLPRWSLCFLMADATGHYGLLEIANNEVIWLDGQNAQANFYVNEKYNALSDTFSGLGRYNNVRKGIGSVKNKDDLVSLMKTVRFSQVYGEPEKALFETKYELGKEPLMRRGKNGKAVPVTENGKPVIIDGKFLADDGNNAAISEHMAAILGKYRSMTREQLKDEGVVWETVYSTIADCSAKTIDVTFHENDKEKLTLKADE